MANNQVIDLGNCKLKSAGALLPREGIFVSGKIERVKGVRVVHNVKKAPHKFYEVEVEGTNILQVFNMMQQIACIPCR